MRKQVSVVSPAWQEHCHEQEQRSGHKGSEGVVSKAHCQYELLSAPSYLLIHVSVPRGFEITPTGEAARTVLGSHQPTTELKIGCVLFLRFQMVLAHGRPQRSCSVHLLSGLLFGRCTSPAAASSPALACGHVPTPLASSNNNQHSGSTQSGGFKDALPTCCYCNLSCRTLCTHASNMSDPHEGQHPDTLERASPTLQHRSVS